MKFEIKKFTVLGYYYIILDDIHNEYVSDNAIVFTLKQYINITLQEYVNILINHNAIMYNLEHYFKSFQDAQNAIDYLNDKYITLIKLMG